MFTTQPSRRVHAEPLPAPAVAPLLAQHRLAAEAERPAAPAAAPTRPQEAVGGAP